MKRSQSAACIDLTGDTYAPAPRRRKTAYGGSPDLVEDLDDPWLQQALQASLVDPEVELVEPQRQSAPTFTSTENQGKDADSDEELAVLGTTGQCFCFMCDSPASECQFWGSGLGSEDHCRAYPSDRYRRRRDSFRRKKAGPTPVPGPSRNTLPWPLHAQRGLHSTSTPATQPLTSSREPLASSGSQSKTKPDGSKTSEKLSLKSAAQGNVIKMYLQIPDPRLDKDLTAIGIVRLPVKAGKDKKIKDLQEALAPYGFADSDPTGPPRGHDTLCIQTLFQQQWEGAKQKPTHLKLCKLPMPKLEKNSTSQRVRKVVIHPMESSGQPQFYGVTVDKKAKQSDLIKAAMQMVGHAGDARGATMSPGHRRIWHKPSSDLEPTSGDMHIFCLPRAPPSPPQASKDHPQVVFVYHEAAQRDAGSMLNPKTLGAPMMLRLPDGMHGSYGGYGGPHTAKQLCKDVCNRLQNVLKPGETLDSEPGVCFKLQRGGQWVGEWPSGSNLDFMTRSDKTASSCFAHGVLWLCAEWTETGLARLDLESWVRLPEDPSCSKEILAETAAREARSKRWDEAQQLCKTMPRTIITEITSHCKVWSPSAIVRLHLQGMATPMIRTICTLDPDDSDASGKRGHVNIELFAQHQSGSSGDRKFFTKPEDWPTGRQLTAAHSLENTISHMLAADPACKRIADKTQKLRAACKHRGNAGIKGLLHLLETGEAPEAEQPRGLTVPLRPYQRQSLKFMQDAEACEGGFGSHLWCKISFKGLTFWWSPILKRACLQDPACSTRGGFLAEEMGLGKTVICLGIILSRPAPAISQSARLVDKRIKSRATLVICAVSLVSQWATEAEDKLGGSLRTCQYHGQNRPRNVQKIAADFDLVITTYQTLSSDFRLDVSEDGAGFKPLGAIHWHRIILDEGHMVKSPGVLQCKAVTALRSNLRWICTGTPINNSVEDLVGQFTALHCKPYSQPGFFAPFIKAPYHQHGPNFTNHADTPLLYLLSCIMVRHTKQQVLGGEAVLALPPKTVETIPVHFTPEEQQLYLGCHTIAKAIFEEIRSWGGNSVSKRLLAINALLLPVRRICSGGALTDKELTVPDILKAPRDPADQIGRQDSGMQAPAGQECTICLEPLVDRPVCTPCRHWFCRECILEALISTQSCPNCRAPLPPASLVEGVPASEDGGIAETTSQAQATDNIKATSESKLLVLLNEKHLAVSMVKHGPFSYVEQLRDSFKFWQVKNGSAVQLKRMRETDSAAKALVFSQYRSTIEWLKVRLTQEGFGYRFITGSMPMKSRAKAIADFGRDPPTTIFLLTTRSGAVGINLTAANHVFLLEPALNPALEEQAIGRAWRMGQKRPVVVKRLFVKGSIEERIMELTKRKVGGSAAEGSSDDEDVEWGSKRNKQLQAANLAGSLKTDRPNLKLEELDLLFQDPTFDQASGSRSSSS